MFLRKKEGGPFGGVVNETSRFASVSLKKNLSLGLNVSTTILFKISKEKGDIRTCKKGSIHQKSDPIPTGHLLLSPPFALSTIACKLGLI